MNTPTDQNLNSSPKGMNRRNFLRGLAGGAAVLGFPTIVPSTVLGQNGNTAPSNRVTVAALSCGNRARICRRYVGSNLSELVALCDPNLERARERQQQWGEDIPITADFREVLARDDIDAVHISTGDYWHVPMALAAARAGKDVFCEKPLAVCIEQCLAAKEITQKYGRIFQYGTQNRAMAQTRMGTELVLNGHIGEVKEVYIWAPPGFSGGTCEEQPVPPDFSYDLWLGPAPRKPFCHDRCLRQGRRNGVYHIYDYAIGFISGWGAHPMDQFQWWADEMGLGIATRFEGTGSIPKDGLFNTIVSWDVEMTYPNGLKVRFCDSETAAKVVPGIDKVAFAKGGQNHGTLYIGEEGVVGVSRGAWHAEPADLLRKGKEPGDKRLVDAGSHLDNFINGVRNRETPVSNLDSAIRSDIACHLSDIAIRLGRPITWDPEQETITGDPEAVAMMSRTLREPWDLNITV